jgi:hexulose-6-phosphate isomerase
MQTKIGIMQGRLSSPEEGRFQSFPRNQWRQEILRAREAGVDYIEWIYDEYGRTANPLSSSEGIAELNALKAEHGIQTPAVCADWLMDFPLIRCTEQEQAEREAVLHALLGKAREIDAWRMVLPFVDASSMKNEKEKEQVLAVLRRALPRAEETGVELHLEADLGPADFADFLAQIPHPMLKVNYDTGNSSGLGYVAHEEFAAYGERIGSIHIKDRLRKPGGGVATMPLGTGSADFDDVFASIRGIGYKGGFTLQAARGADGDEVEWIRGQIAFVRSNWS